MRQFSAQDTLLIVGLLIVAVVVGVLSGKLGWCLFVAVSLWAILQQLELRRLKRWVARPITRPSNRLNTWYETSNQLYQYIKRDARSLQTLP